MKEKLKNTKGITLIALIITIIVLLILAMVSIKLVWDEGIITHAKNAVNAYKDAQTNELEQFNELENELLGYSNGTSATQKKDIWEVIKSRFVENGENSTLIAGLTMSNPTPSGHLFFASSTSADEVSNIWIYYTNMNTNELYMMLMNDTNTHELLGVDENQSVDLVKEHWYSVTDLSTMTVVEINTIPNIMANIPQDEISDAELYQLIVDSFNK